MKKTSKIKVIDMGWNKILSDNKKLDNMTIEAGLFGEGDSPKNNIAYRGVVMEFGAKIKITDKMRRFLHAVGIHVKNETEEIVIPKRDFMKKAFDLNQAKLKKAVITWYKQLTENKIDLKMFLNKIGVLMESDIKNSISQGSWVKNHPATIKNKKSSKPLIDSGEMLRSVKYKHSKQSLASIREV